MQFVCMAYTLLVKWSLRCMKCKLRKDLAGEQHILYLSLNCLCLVY